MILILDIVFCKDFKQVSSMRIYPLEIGRFKLDGGAMFGVVPKSLWERTNPADANNMIDIALRSMLIEQGDRLILIDAGMGEKQSEKFFGHYYVHPEYSIDKALAKLGFHRDQITDVFLTHLHFDHCGGAIEWNASKSFYQPAFKNAIYWSNKAHWDWAINPNAREKASFLKENILPIQESGQLQFIPFHQQSFIDTSPLDFGILLVDGHTEKQMIPQIQYQGKTIAFTADLLPTVGHLPLPYIMSFDTRPLLTLQEKEQFLNKAAKDDIVLFLEHDARNELCTVKQTEKGVRLQNTFTFNDFFN